MEIIKEIFVDGVHEYNLIIDDDTYILKHSNGAQWQSNVRGKQCFKYTNTGNGVVFTQNKIGKMDYCELSYMYIILRYTNKSVYQVSERKEL